MEARERVLKPLDEIIDGTTISCLLCSLARLIKFLTKGKGRRGVILLLF